LEKFTRLKRIFYGFPEDNLRGWGGRGEELRKWRINGVNGRVARRIIRTMQKFGEIRQRDLDGRQMGC